MTTIKRVYFIGDDQMSIRQCKNVGWLQDGHDGNICITLQKRRGVSALSSIKRMTINWVLLNRNVHTGLSTHNLFGHE